MERALRDMLRDMYETGTPLEKCLAYMEVEGCRYGLFGDRSRPEAESGSLVRQPDPGCPEPARALAAHVLSVWPPAEAALLVTEKDGRDVLAFVIRAGLREPLDGNGSAFPESWDGLLPDRLSSMPVPTSVCRESLALNGYTPETRESRILHEGRLVLGDGEGGTWAAPFMSADVWRRRMDRLARSLCLAGAGQEGPFATLPEEAAACGLDMDPLPDCGDGRTDWLLSAMTDFFGAVAAMRRRDRSGCAASALRSAVHEESRLGTDIQGSAAPPDRRQGLRNRRSRAARRWNTLLDGELSSMAEKDPGLPGSAAHRRMQKAFRDFMQETSNALNGLLDPDDRHDAMLAALDVALARLGTETVPLARCEPPVSMSSPSDAAALAGTLETLAQHIGSLAEKRPA